MPDAFIGVDVIVGTRGETEEYFEQAYRFIQSLDVTQLHVFSYSERPGTQALKIEHVVSSEEKHRRSRLLLDLSDEKTRAFYALSGRQCLCCWNVLNLERRCMASLRITSGWKCRMMMR